MKFIHRILAKQAREPSGLLGKLASRMMTKKNRDITMWTLELLEPQPDDRILEIGFGPGLGIQAAVNKVPNGSVAGLDLSQTMLRTAAERNRAAIESGRVDLRIGDAGDMPYPDDEFDRVFAVNVLYFWPNPKPNLQEIRRVLAPNGKVALAFLDAEDMQRQPWAQTEVFNIFGAEQMVELLQDTGFSDATYRRSDVHEDGSGICALAVA